MISFRSLPLVAALLATAAPNALEPQVLPGVAASDEGRQRVEAFTRWLSNVRAGEREGLEHVDLAEARRLVGDLSLWGGQSPERGPLVLAPLLDLLGLCLTRGGLADPEARGAPQRGELTELARRTIAVRLDPASVEWIAREVAVLAASPLERRLAAVWILCDERTPQGLLAVLATAQGDEPLLADVALHGLVGWNDPGVTGLFLTLWERAGDDVGDARLQRVEQHLAQLGAGPNDRKLERGSRTEARLARLVEERLAGSSWREASRAVACAAALSDVIAIPRLIAGLDTWVDRGRLGTQSRRVQWEIVRALEQRSGRTIGIHVDSWRLWWAAVREGRIELDGRPGEGEPALSEAGFFGLRPVSDRITFVIDRSGSMDEPFGSSTRTASERGHSRYDEAVEQMLRFLQTLGPQARFNVVLFSDGTDVWHDKLRPATEAQLGSARSWLGARIPKGGTQLRGGVERALHVRGGGVDPEELEVDTIVVLCDGATAEGPGWVRDFLEQFNHRARIAFQCVQIGERGDGTLELLAELSGGDFVSVDG